MEAVTLLEHRILFLFEIVSPISANRLVSQLLLLDAASHTDDIDLYINSPGGSVSDGLAIIDTIQCIKAPVTTICIGQAFSMAAWILASGKKGFRFASPNAEIMIHQIAANIRGETSDIAAEAARMIQLQNSLIAMISKWTGQQAMKIRKNMERDFFMTPQEALEFGIIDKVLNPYED